MNSEIQHQKMQKLKFIFKINSFFRPGSMVKLLCTNRKSQSLTLSALRCLELIHTFSKRATIASVDKFQTYIVLNLFYREEIYHELDFKKIQITVDGEAPNEDQSNLDKTFEYKLNALFNQLKSQIKSSNIFQNITKVGSNGSTSKKDKDKDKNGDNYSKLEGDICPMGKIQIHIREAVNVFNLHKNSLLYVRIRFEPFTCKTKKQVNSENPQWKQDFVIPINDTYGTMYLDLISIIHDGLLSRHETEKVVGTAEVLIADLLSYHSDQKIKFINLPLELTKPMTEQQKSYLIVSIRNHSSIFSLFSAPPYDRYEGERQELNLNDVKIHFTRFRRVISIVGSFVLSLEDIFDQKYPKFTLAIYCVLFLQIMLIEMNQILVYIVFGLLSLLAYQNPYIKPMIQQWVQVKLLDQINPSYMVPVVMTEEEFDFTKTSSSLSELINIEGDNVQLNKKALKDKADDDKESLYQKFRAMKKQFLIIQIYLTQFASASEKIFNLFTWKEYTRTLYFFITLFVVYCVFRVLPLRYIMLVLVVVEWFDGKSYYKKRQAHNYRIAKILVEYIYKKHHPELFRSFHYMEINWPDQSFKSKVIEEIRLHLPIHMSEEVMNDFKNPNDLIRALMTCTTKLKLKRIIDITFIRDELYYDLRRQCKHRLKPQLLIWYTINNFCYNIPSEYYRLKHPRKLLFE